MGIKFVSFQSICLVLTFNFETGVSNQILIKEWEEKIEMNTAVGMFTK